MACIWSLRFKTPATYRSVEFNKLSSTWNSGFYDSITRCLFRNGLLVCPAIFFMKTISFYYFTCLIELKKLNARKRQGTYCILMLMLDFSCFFFLILLPTCLNISRETLYFKSILTQSAILSHTWISRVPTATTNLAKASRSLITWVFNFINTKSTYLFNFDQLMEQGVGEKGDLRKNITNSYRPRWIFDWSHPDLGATGNISMKVIIAST